MFQVCWMGILLSAKLISAGSDNCGVPAMRKAGGVPAIHQAPIRRTQLICSHTHVRKAMLRPAHAWGNTCRAHVLFPGGCLPSHVWWQAAAEDARHHQGPVSWGPDCSGARSSHTCSSSTSAGPLPCTWCGPRTRAGSPTSRCRMSLIGRFEPPVSQCCTVCLRVLLNACTSHMQTP